MNSIIKLINDIFETVPNDTQLFVVDLCLERLKHMKKIDDFYNLQQENGGISVIIKTGNTERLIDVH